MYITVNVENTLKKSIANERYYQNEYLDEIERVRRRYSEEKTFFGNDKYGTIAEAQSAAAKSVNSTLYHDYLMKAKRLNRKLKNLDDYGVISVNLSYDDWDFIFGKTKL